MKFFDMFAGVGGFHLGIQQAYDISNQQSATIVKDGQGRNGNTNEVEHDVLPTSRTTPLCIGYSEIDKYAIKVYERHFNEHRNYGDATAIVASDLPDFDLLVGGFPCQAFSIAGKRKGFNDTRGTLFFDIARILAEKRPRHLVLENVKGLLSHESGKTLQTILGVLSDLGYRTEYQVLNSKDFGVPQNRERIYFVGHLRGECSGEIFPVTGDSGKAIKTIGQINNAQSGKVYSTNGVSTTLAANGGGNGAKTGLYAVPVLTPERLEKRQNGRRFKENGEPAFTVTAQDRHGIAIDMTRRAENNYRVRKDGRAGTLDANYYKGLANQERPGVKDGLRIRRLTPLECERLQGFPDQWTALDQEGNPISDTQRYKMAGNAVTTNVVQAVMTNLIKECL